MKSDQSFPKSQHLKHPHDIRSVLESKEKYVSSSMVLRVKRIEDQGLKACFIVSKKIGNAAKRNRVKRLMREGFRRQKDLFEKSLWLAFIARSEVRLWEYKKVFEDITKFTNRMKKSAESCSFK